MGRKIGMTDQQTVSMTQQGYDALVLELSELKETKLPAAIQRVADARAHGDLSENSEYHAAREDLAVIYGRVEEIEFLIQRAEVIESVQNGTVNIGSQVIVEIEGQDGHHTFHIVGEWEADPTQRKISEKSPLGQALSGKKKGDRVELEVPAGKVIYSIHEVK